MAHLSWEDPAQLSALDPWGGVWDVGGGGARGAMGWMSLEFLVGERKTQVKLSQCKWPLGAEMEQLLHGYDHLRSFMDMFLGVETVSYTFVFMSREAHISPLESQPCL